MTCRGLVPVVPDAVERIASIRRMTVKDLPVARTLPAHLGYTLEAQELHDRYQAVAQSADHTLLVAEEDGSVIALCHIYARPALDKPPEAVVQRWSLIGHIRARD